MKIPKVFISYSHDSQEHKKWVLEFAERMRNNGIDAIIDQWELKPGDDLPHFMETHLASADKIIMVCSENYVKKANEGKGGVGYEKMIITANLLKKIDENKIIPIIKQNSSHDVPTFLKTKMYLNFSNADVFEFSFDELIRTIHDSPLLKKPKIGNNPFKQINTENELKTNNSLLVVMKIITNLYNLTSTNYVLYSQIAENANISRIMLDYLLDEAKSLDLITQDHAKDVYLTEKGRTFAINNNLY